MTDDEVTIGEVVRRLGNIESKMDKILDDHESRLRRVERGTYVALGVAVAAGMTGAGSILSAAGG